METKTKIEIVESIGRNIFYSIFRDMTSQLSLKLQDEISVEEVREIFSKLSFSFIEEYANILFVSTEVNYKKAYILAIINKNDIEITVVPCK